MGDILENKIWINENTCLTMAESIDSFTDYGGEKVYHKKGSDNTIIIQGLGRIHLPLIETYPLYFKGIDDNSRVLIDYYVCSKEEYIDAINHEINIYEQEIKYYKDLLDSVSSQNN